MKAFFAVHDSGRGTFSPSNLRETTEALQKSTKGAMAKLTHERSSTLTAYPDVTHTSLWIADQAMSA
jgi:hypothetical protein